MLAEKLVSQSKFAGKGCLYAVRRGGLATGPCQCQPVLPPGPFVQP